MTGSTLSARAHLQRTALRTGTAMGAALALAGLAAPVAAQSVNGTINAATSSGFDAPVVSGNTTTIAINAPEAVIEWNATAGSASATNVDFLPSTATLSFTASNPSGSSDYTVLNRVFPRFDPGTGTLTDVAATISLSGKVTSDLGGIGGGNVWFYSPYGIIANGTASFNVGSLLLTTSDIDTSNGGSLYLSQAGGTTIGFKPASQANSFVRILPGAQITANGSVFSPDSAYVGMFAPRIEQGGTITAGRMAALVAAEAGTITFNAGLIDIQVTQGTDESQHNGIVHTGTTGGPASTGAPQTIAMVAIPKNNALTMLLGGSIGYDAATVAVPDPSGVILSAGYQPTATAADLAAGLGSLQIGNTTFTSPTTAYATGTLAVLPQFISAANPGLVDFRATTTLVAGKQINLVAGAGQEIRGGDSLSLIPLLPYRGENVAITVTGSGQIDVLTDLVVDASGTPPKAAGAPPANGGDSRGGDITVSVSQGKLSAGNSMSFVSNGYGEDADSAAGSGFGGSIDLGVSNLGTISATAFSATSTGLGGFGFGTGGAGGNGTGNRISLHDDGGTLRFGDVTLDAEGLGNGGSVSGGSGAGGRIDVTIGGGQAQTWNFLNADASSSNGSGSLSAGNSQGRLNSLVQLDGITLRVTGSGSSLAVGSLNLDNNAFVYMGGASPYDIHAGSVNVLAEGGGTLGVNGSIRLSAAATFGPDSGGNVLASAPGMTGGSVSLLANGGTINAVDIAARTDAIGIAALTTGANAKGGDITVGALNGGAIALQSGQVPSGIRLSSVALGGVGPVPGNAQGGRVTLYAQDGSIDTNGGAILLTAAALSGGVSDVNGGLGFVARGGDATLEIRPGSTGSIVAGDITINAKGEATVTNLPPDPFGDYALGFTVNDILAINGNGGLGKGGNATLNVATGSLTAGNITVHANGLGGSSGFAASGNPSFRSGDGQGGSALVSQTGGTFSASRLDVLAQGQGGGFDDFGSGPASVPLAGTGFGGIAQVSLAGGTMTLPSPLTIASLAIGGVGTSTNDALTTAGNGGLGDNRLGLAELRMPFGSTALLTVPSISVLAQGFGGAAGTNQAGGQSGNGGAAFGGTARYSLADGGFSFSDGTFADATATGGAGDTGGDATGGTAAFLLIDTLAAPSTTRTTGPLRLSASPVGGAGTVANGIATAGTTKFTAQAGRSSSALTIAGDFNADANGFVAPAGDGFTGNFGSVPVTVTGSAAISTVRDINMSVAGGGGLDIAGTLDLLGANVTTTGPGVLSAGGNVSVQGFYSINLGGLSSGGTTFLEAVDPLTEKLGPVSVASLTSAGLVTAYTGSFSAFSPGALSFDNSFADTGDFSVQATGDLTVQSITAPGRIKLGSTSGALQMDLTIAGGSLLLSAGGNVIPNGALVTATSLGVTAGGTFVSPGPLTVPGATSIDAAGGITIPALNSGGTTFLRSTGGAVLITDLLSGGPVTLAGRSATIGSTGALTYASATTSGGDLLLTTTGNLTATNADASGAVVLTSTGGSVQSAGLIRATGNVAVNGAQGVGLAGLNSGGTTSLQGNAAPVSVSALTSVGAVTANGSAVTIGSPGSLTFASATANGGALRITAGGLAAFNGLATGSTISVASGDIRIGATGRIGQRGVTSAITLTNTSPAAGSFIGGTGSAGAWSLDAAEAQRLFADQSITIGTGTAPSPADVAIGNLTLTYGAGAAAVGPGANIGTGGTLAVSTAGKIRVIGALAPVMSSNGDIVSLTGGKIDVVTDTGSIVLKNAGGALSGTLRMTAPTIRVATTAALASLDAITLLPQASLRLDSNDGIVNDAGALQANAIAVTTGTSTFYVQNSGVDALPGSRRGFTANSLTIDGISGVNPAFAINGVILGPNGIAITGLDTYHAISVNGSFAALGGAFIPFSTVNGCAIGIDCRIKPEEIAPPGDTIGELTKVLNPGSGADSLLNLPVVQFGEPPLLNSPPLIDEPVTGIGNDDLWQQHCDAEKDCRG